MRITAMLTVLLALGLSGALLASDLQAAPANPLVEADAGDPSGGGPLEAAAPANASASADVDGAVDIDDTQGWFKTMLAKGAAKEWLPAVMALLIIGVGLLRKYAGKGPLAWFKSKWGGYVLAALGALALHVVAPLSAGVPFGFGLLTTAFLSFLASGKVVDVAKRGA